MNPLPSPPLTTENSPGHKYNHNTCCRWDEHVCTEQAQIPPSTHTLYAPQVREMFNFAMGKYMDHAYPYDELRPLSCTGKNVFGPKGYR